ncbi:hypothetical protein D9757_002976 [Collybiopsis confluens]|uniref:Uncharacterized protein n=1 Tax=Collybiopsis confluens TaxID=2823264 RepID=A0A8H5MDD3_9AGAR|nr:hypothetical protein D9757_002976 [Collybiopsis confluens]
MPDRERGKHSHRSRSPSRRSGDRHHDASEERYRERRRSRSRSRDPAPKRRKHSHSRSRSGDRSRHKRHRERAESVSSASSAHSARRRRRKEKKRERREKKEKKKKSSSSSSQWGKFGIISEADIFIKSSEFQIWLVEERKINPETISKDQNKKEFARFVEDYNTATLPHEKYYNMEAYDKRMAAMRAGEFLPPTDDHYDPSVDMKALSTAHKKQPGSESSTYLNKEHLMELRKVQNERVEAGKMKLLGMEIKQNMGVRWTEDILD